MDGKSRLIKPLQPLQQSVWIVVVASTCSEIRLYNVVESLLFTVHMVAHFFPRFRSSLKLLSHLHTIPSLKCLSKPFTNVTVNLNCFHTFSTEITNYRAYFTVSGIFNERRHFKYVQIFIFLSFWLSFYIILWTSKLIFFCFLQEKYDEVKIDCTQALHLNPKNVKALQMRAKACELTNQLQQCHEDLTTVLMLEGFQNQSTLSSVERALNKLGM